MLPKTLRPALRSRVALCGKSRRKPASALRLVENRLAVDKSHGGRYLACDSRFVSLVPLFLSRLCLQFW